MEIMRWEVGEVRKISIAFLSFVIVLSGVTWLSGSNSAVQAEDLTENVINESVEPQAVPAVAAAANIAIRNALPHIGRWVLKVAQVAVNAAASAYGAYMGTKAAQASVGNQDTATTSVDFPEEIFD